MNRRRMMMLQQQRSKFELEYHSSSGVYPENIEGWSCREGNYNGAFGAGGRTLADGLLVVKANHSYENVLYYPTEHLTASKCEASATVEAWENTVVSGAKPSPGIVRIGLTDGINYAIGAVSNSYLYIGNAANDNSCYGTWVARISISPPQKFTFKVKFMSGKAEYYIDDELIYNQDTPLSVDSVDYGGRSNKMVDKPMNFIGVGGACITKISAMSYEEG